VFLNIKYNKFFIIKKSKQYLYKYDWFFNNKKFIIFYAKSINGKAVMWDMEHYCNYNQLSTIILNGNSTFWYRFSYASFVASITSNIFVVGFDFLEELECWMENFSYVNYIGICFYQNFIYFCNLNLNYNFFDLYVYFFYIFNFIVWIIFIFINNLILKLINLWENNYY